jgi:hypothetical protein
VKYQKGLLAAIQQNPDRYGTHSEELVKRFLSILKYDLAFIKCIIDNGRETIKSTIDNF